MSAPCAHQPLAPAHASGMSANGRKLVARIVNAVRGWNTRYRTRVRLADLDDRTLQDIGLTRHEARIESSRPFWQ